MNNENQVTLSIESPLYRQSELEKFLSFFPSSLVQTFDDLHGRQNPLLARVFPYEWEQVKSFQEQGAGAFFSINPIDGKERTIASLAAIRALVLDLDVGKEKDNKTLSEIVSLKKDLFDRIQRIKWKPHFIIETKNGFQAIWLFDTYTNYTSNVQANELYKAVARGMGKVIGTLSEGDNVVRVFRLPYTYHLKTPSAPFLVQLFEDNSSLSPYQFSDFIEEFGQNVNEPSVTMESILPALAAPKKSPRIDELPVDVVLIAVAREKSIVITFKAQSNGTQTIIENGVETSGFISQTGDYCYSMSGKDRKGSALGIVKYYLKCSEGEAKKWLYKTYKVNIPYSASDLAKDILSNRYIAQLGKAYFKCIGLVWKEIEPEYVKNLVIKEMNGQGIYHNQSRIMEVQKYLDIYAYNTHGRKLAKSIKSDSRKRNEISFKNCLVNVDTWIKRDCRPDDYSVTRIPFAYEEKPFNCPLWLRFLHSVFEGKGDKEEVIDFIQEWIGYTLINDTSLERALILLGEGSNGKSVLLYVWGLLVGQNNCSHIDLGDINKEQYTAQLLGKIVNMATDVRSENQLDTGIFKRLVSGEIITGKSIYQKPIEFTNYARLLFATNTLPHLKDGGVSLQRRLHIVRFENIFKDNNKDINLKFTLKSELDDILLWAIEGLKRLRDRGDFLPPKSVKMEVDSYLHENDNLALFLEDRYDVTKDALHNEVERDVFYSEYVRYCNANGYRPLSNRKAYERLRIRGILERKSMGNRYFVGIKPLGIEPVQDEIIFPSRE